MPDFQINSEYTPKGDQPRAIQALSRGINAGKKHQVLLGVTGSGKTFTMAHVIATVKKPALVIAPNKTLAAQLYQELKGLFPHNAVEYFVSYYDYYQPEAYIPASDTYIQKDSSINDMIDKMRHSATRSVLTRQDVIVVASVSCIYGLGSPEDYLAMRVELALDMEINRDKLIKDLVIMHYDRNDMDFHRGTFRVRGDRVEIFPAYEEETAIRIDFFGDEIEAIAEIDPLKGDVITPLKRMTIFPGSHYVTQRSKRRKAIATIKAELKERVDCFRETQKLIEAQRIEERTLFDLEMIQEIGYCNGIENYSRHLTGRQQNEPPPTLLDYFTDEFVIFIDESHIAVPQLRAMYRGDRSRKETLVNFGFRLPSALDNRPLNFEEFRERAQQVIYISATPAEYELEQAEGVIVDQIVRPTGLLDPFIEVRSATHQVDDLHDEIQKRIKKNERVLVTTLSKRMSEDLTDYYQDLGINVRYLHSDIKTVERMEIIKELRLGGVDVLIGINLLREGLDIPEVSLVAILDADKEGFLRSERSLIQTCGRAARNADGRVIMYADQVTPAMRTSIDETLRRREIQETYNQRHQITPTSIQKEIVSIFDTLTPQNAKPQQGEVNETLSAYGTQENLPDIISQLEAEMKQAASELAFEKAARLRDRIRELKEIQML